MGGDSKSRKKHLEETSEASSSTPSISSDSESSPRSKKSSSRRHKRSSTSRRDKEKKRRERAERHHRRRKERRERSSRENKRRSKKRAEFDSDDDGDSISSGGDESEPEVSREDPETVLRSILKEFPGVAEDLKQLLQVIDDGQAVDTSGMPNKSLVKLLKRLFVSLSLKENGTGIFLLPTTQRPTLEVVGSIITSHLTPKEQQYSNSASINGTQSPQSVVKDDGPPAPRRSLIGPEMPSSELLAAAAKLAEAEAVLREAELEDDTGLFIGPPPPAVVAEAASANEAERFEEVTRIMAVEGDSPYDVLGVNLNMSTDNVKKRYWKLSLLVHPDKCPHPQSHQAFVKLNQAFKDLQDPDKRKALDDKIRLKEEQEEFKAELQACREAAQWRRLQGISMPGDDELLEVFKPPQERDEWMTTLPPERKPGMTMHSTTSFSKTTKEGRGDTSVWTDTPMGRAQKAKMNYLEAYNEAAALAANEEETKRKGSDADLVDQYNQSKRSKSLVQKHKEAAASSRSKKKIKQQPENEEWVGNHPWKPWDREKDLTSGRQKVNFDSESMGQGLSSRFSAGSVQRNFL